MGLGDKIQETVGKAKEGLGDALDNEKLRRDGQKDRLEANAKEAAERKLLIGSGDRSERIRTYNFPQGRVTDHRINLTLYNLDRIVLGALDEVIDALKYAEGVNSAGYNLCIVNGRFVTMTGTHYGVVTNDAQADFLAGLLESKVMEAPKISGSPVIPPASDYTGACKQADTVRNVLNTLVNRTVLTHDKSAAEDKNFSAAFISFNMLSSGNLGFTATLSEDEASRDAMAQMWTSFGVTDMKIERTAPHTYELTGTRAGMETPFLIRCMFAPTSGALRLVEMDGDRAVELFEYVPLGGDTYAFQTISERAVVKYQGDRITDFTYSLLKSENALYSPDVDGIYDKTGLDAAWVTAAGEDLFEQLVTYDGTILKIYAESFFTGSRITADINVPQNP